LEVNIRVLIPSDAERRHSRFPNYCAMNNADNGTEADADGKYHRVCVATEPTRALLGYSTMKER
jgi:hypothetical protein